MKATPSTATVHTWVETQIVTEEKRIGATYLQDAVAAEEQRLAAERNAEDAQLTARQRARVPFPDASNPEALARDGALVDISLFTDRAVVQGSTVTGLDVKVFATVAVGEALAAAGPSVQTIAAALYYAIHRYGGPFALADFAPAPFIVGGGDAGPQVRLVGWRCPTTSGSRFVIVTTETEVCPCWVPKG